MNNQIGIAILGGGGFGAFELLRLLANHPIAKVVSVVSSSHAGKPISEIHPGLHTAYTLHFHDQLQPQLLESFIHRFIVTALPHGVSARIIQENLAQWNAQNIRVIDLSGDFRLHDTAARQCYYPESTVSPDIIGKFVYGLPELSCDTIRPAQNISNPGCLATAAVLAAAPIVARWQVELLTFDLKTGSSGAGQSLRADLHHPLRHASVSAYKLLEHRHEPEVVQTLSTVRASPLRTMFVPHLLPISRGILATVYTEIPESINREQLLQQVRSYYSTAPFIRVSQNPVELSNVVGSNYCDISVAARGRQLVVTAAIDNLVKGMAGQAIQNLNIMCGLDQATGLRSPGMQIV